jgi:acetolactate synthase-1/2/3 large subunit
LNKYTTEHGYLYPNAQYIHVDAAPHVVMGGNHTADLYIQSDARLAAEAIEAALAEKGFQQTGYRTPEVKALLDTAYDDDTKFDTEPNTVDPRDACRVIDEVLPSEIGLILGGGHQITFGTMLFLKQRSLVLANQHFGCIGQGLTTAMGAIIAAGGQPAVLMEGDAGLMMHLAEFETAVRYNLPLFVVVINDQALGAEYHKMHVKGMKSEFATVPSPDLGAVAVSLGGRGRKCTSIDEVRAAAEEFAANPAPTMIDVRVSRNVLSVPYRRLHYGQDD